MKAMPKPTEPGRDALAALERKLLGPLIRPDHHVYEQARRIYNGAIDRRPLAVARVAGPEDVAACVEFARQTGLPLAIRGGGHSVAGLSTCDDGLVCDLGALDAVEVDPGRGIVRVGAGATHAGIDAVAHPHGLAVPAGTVASTGIAGLALGGGSGYLTRKYGLTIDNLREADVVLADGRLVTASEKVYPDLFWALRGGGGNFGVVTRFTFQARPVSQVVGGPMLWPLERGDEVMAWYDELMAGAPEDLYGFLILMTVPPIEHFPKEMHGRKACGVVWCWLGPPEEGRRALAPPASLGAPAVDLVGPMPFPALQSLFDPLIPRGLHWYVKGEFINDLSREAIATHLRHAARAPVPMAQMHLYPIDGAAHRVGPRDTAFSYRDARYSMVIFGVSEDPGRMPAMREWAREYWQALRPFSSGGGYVNFLMDEGPDRVRRAYRDNFERLAAVKKVYDPGNVLRLNQNIEPAA